MRARRMPAIAACLMLLLGGCGGPRISGNETYVTVIPADGRMLKSAAAPTGGSRISNGWKARARSSTVIPGRWHGKIGSYLSMRLRRGFLWLGIACAAVWFVFWTFAYVIGSHTSLTPEPASVVMRVTAWRVLGPSLIVAIVLAGWIAAGFGERS